MSAAERPRRGAAKGSSTSRARTGATAACTRSERSPSTTMPTQSCALCLHAAPSAPRVPDRSERLAARTRRWRADLLVVAAALLPLALFIVRERQVAGAPGFPLDDSWIHLHFARNLAAGAGFSYNPGVPIAGSTAPLWP